MRAWYHSARLWNSLTALGLTGALLAAACRRPHPPRKTSPAASSAPPNGVNDLTASFVQTYRSGVLGREVVEHGTLAIKRPGRMRWEYKEPEKKTFVSDGKTFYFYVPADKQVIVQRAGGRARPPGPPPGRAGHPREFQVSSRDGPAGRERLRLVPRKADPEVERVFLDVDAEARIRAIDDPGRPGQPQPLPVRGHARRTSACHDAPVPVRGPTRRRGRHRMRPVARPGPALASHGLRDAPPPARSGRREGRAASATTTAPCIEYSRRSRTTPRT